METDPPNRPRRRTTSFLPRRGRVKAQIFSSLAAEMSSLASRTGKVFSRLKRGGASAATSAATSTAASAATSAATSTAASATTTPPPSAYASDDDPDHA